MDNLKSILGLLKARAVFVVLILIMTSSIHTGFKLKGRGGAIEEARTRLEEEETKRIELEAIRESLGSVEFIEQQARDKLGLAQEGEVIVVLPPEEVLRSLAPKEEFVDSGFEQETRPIWRQWVRLFLPEVDLWIGA